MWFICMKLKYQCYIVGSARQSIRIEDIGLYRCTSENEVGSGESKDTDVKVNGELLGKSLAIVIYELKSDV